MVCSTQIEFAGNLAVTQSFGDQRDDLFLAWGEQVRALGI